MDTTTKLLLGGAALGGAYFLLKNKAGETVGVGTLAFVAVGDDCWAEVTIKNTGGLTYIPKVSFAIRPTGYVEHFAAIPKDGAEYVPGETQTITTNRVRIPTYALEGPIWARIQIGKPDGTVIPGAEVEIAEAYTVGGYGAEIVSYTFHSVTPV